jgi:hypothetical protein
MRLFRGVGVDVRVQQRGRRGADIQCARSGQRCT